MEVDQRARVEPLTTPRFADIPEPQMVALVCSTRAGSKILQSYLDSHESILMIPGYPLMYLYPHWETWSQQSSGKLTWERATDLFCEKHGSVLDSGRVPSLTGLEHLGQRGDEHVEVDEEEFRSRLETMLDGVPVSRRTFLLAVHFAYGLCKGWDLRSKPVLFFHIHSPPYLKELAEDFPDLKVVQMTRNPRSGLHSTVRALGIADQQKLNATDSLMFAGRNYWLACQYQLEAMNAVAPFLDRANVVCLKLESLHQHHEATMQALAAWLAVDFSESMLKSTFDGKLWWGDFFTEGAVNGLDPQALSDKWRESVIRSDIFVTEGIQFQLFERYGYDRTEYHRDTRLNRLLLVLAILLPSKAEWETLAFYLNPVTHLKFLRAALDESTGRLPRKDYTWNASYHYKFTYIDLKLWRPRLHHRILTFAENLAERSGRQGLAGVLVPLSRALYVGAQYGRFWLAICGYPREIFRRWRICYGSLRRRLSQKNYLPPLLGHN